MAESSEKIGMSHVEQRAYFALVRAGRRVATPAVLAALLGIATVRATLILHRLNKKGSVRKIGKGFYAVLAPENVGGKGQFVSDPFVVAAEIMALAKREYSVAYLSAAYLHGLLEQLPQEAQVMVAHYRRSVRLSQAQVIRFVIVSDWKLFGTLQTRYQGKIIMMTDLEKTVLDCLDRMDLAGGMEQAAQILAVAAREGKLHARKLARYARQMRNRSLIQRLGYLLDKGRLLPETVKALQPLRRPVPCLLDPASSRVGKFDARWHVVLNSQVSMRA